MKLLKFLFIGFFIISCSNEDKPNNPDNNERLISEINANLFVPDNLPVQQGSKFTFEYDINQRLTKKKGGFLAIAAASVFSQIFSNEVYTSLIYANNNVTVENFYTSADLTVPKDTKLFHLNSLNQIETKEIPNLLSNYLSKKQLFRYSENKLVEIITSYPNMPYDATEPTDYIWTFVENFYYDSNDNLTKTEYFEQQNGVNKGQKIVRTFEDYDNSVNPCKRFQLLDEFFYRSLSKNNFRKYTEVQYNDGVKSESKTIWTFRYDSNGQIIVN